MRGPYGSWLVGGLDPEGDQRRFEIKKADVVAKVLELSEQGYTLIEVYKPVGFCLTTSVTLYDDNDG